MCPCIRYFLLSKKSPYYKVGTNMVPVTSVEGTKVLLSYFGVNTQKKGVVS